MRSQFVLSEIMIGLRRNLTMTVAVVVSAAGALGMLGVALMMYFQVIHMKSYWYNKVEVSVFMCTAEDQKLRPAQCAGGLATDAQIGDIKGKLLADQLVQTVYPESQQEAWQHYQDQNKGGEVSQYVRVDQMPASLRVKLKDPTTQNIDAIRTAYSSLPGVEEVSDQRTILKPLFKLLSGLTLAAVVVCVVMVGLALMLIVNTVRLSAFSRRRETGIMRLVGASNFYIRLPFLMEAAVAGLAGVGAASLGVVGFKFFLIDKVLKPSFAFTSFVGWDAVVTTIVILIPIGLVMSVGASSLSLRKYLKV